ncbi:hypothetical protein JCM8547_003136 [Rhodosporidiobolus lusitaniae]
MDPQRRPRDRATGKGSLATHAARNAHRQKDDAHRSEGRRASKSEPAPPPPPPSVNNDGVQAAIAVALAIEAGLTAAEKEGTVVLANSSAASAILRAFTRYKHGRAADEMETKGGLVDVYTEVSPVDVCEMLQEKPLKLLPIEGDGTGERGVIEAQYNPKAELIRVKAQVDKPAPGKQARVISVLVFVGSPGPIEAGKLLDEGKEHLLSGRDSTYIVNLPIVTNEGRLFQQKIKAWIAPLVILTAVNSFQQQSIGGKKLEHLAEAELEHALESGLVSFAQLEVVFSVLFLKHQLIMRQKTEGLDKLGFAPDELAQMMQDDFHEETFTDMVNFVVQLGDLEERDDVSTAWAGWLMKHNLEKGEHDQAWRKWCVHDLESLVKFIKESEPQPEHESGEHEPDGEHDPTAMALVPFSGPQHILDRYLQQMEAARKEIDPYAHVEQEEMRRREERRQSHPRRQRNSWLENEDEDDPDLLRDLEEYRARRHRQKEERAQERERQLIPRATERSPSPIHRRRTDQELMPLPRAPSPPPPVPMPPPFNPNGPFPGPAMPSQELPFRDATRKEKRERKERRASTWR